jgi:hypothetical protein
MSCDTATWPETGHLTDVGTDAVLRHCLDEFPWVSLAVTGSCMEPYLRGGERVHLSRRAPQMGDVVLARHRTGLRLHRLVWGPPLPLLRSWWTQADRGPIWDSRIAPEDVLATVETVEGRSLPRWPVRFALRSLAVGLASRARELFSR